MKTMLSKMGNGRLGLLGCALALVLAGCQLPQEGSTPVSQEDSQAPLAMAEETVCALRARYGQGMIDKADLLRAELVAAQVRLWETPETDQAAYASACAAILEKLEAVRTWAAGYAKGFGDELPLCRVEAELARFRFCECATLGGDEAALRETFVGAAARYLQLAEAQQTSAGCTNPLVGEARLWFQEALDAAPSLQ